MKHKSIRKRIHGEKNPAAKFTDLERQLAKTLPGRVTDIAEQLNMSIPHVCNLRKSY